MIKNKVTNYLQEAKKIILSNGIYSDDHEQTETFHSNIIMIAKMLQLEDLNEKCPACGEVKEEPEEEHYCGLIDCIMCGEDSK